MSDIVDNRLLKKIVEGLSQMDKSAEVQTDKKGNIIYDRDTADSEIVNINTSIDKHMEKYVLPFIPDAKAFFEEDLGKKRPVIKTGAEIPFTRYFYEYQKLEKSNVLGDKIRNLENKINAEMQELFR